MSAQPSPRRLHSQGPWLDPWLDAWYGSSRWTYLLLPLTGLFIVLSGLRRYWLRRYRQKKLPTPVVVVGNISVGGTGKTPLIIALIQHLQQQGFQPGVISRGYGGSAERYPYLLGPSSTAATAGDEPLAIFRRTGAPVVVGPDRVANGKVLEDQGCDVLLSDDGLQHYRLGRDIEIAVVDGTRGLGNGWRLPVGPLRESPSRLREVDWVVVNSPQENVASNVSEGKRLHLPGFFIPMQMYANHLIHLQTGRAVSFAEVPKRICAVAGIGNPQRFADTLQQAGFEPELHAFPDHHAFERADFDFPQSMPLIMTEKDAVKCQTFAQENWFYLPIVAQLPDTFWNAFSQKVERIIANKKSRFSFR